MAKGKGSENKKKTHTKRSENTSRDRKLKKNFEYLVVIDIYFSHSRTSCGQKYEIKGSIKISSYWAEPWNQKKIWYPMKMDKIEVNN